MKDEGDIVNAILKLCDVIKPETFSLNPFVIPKLSDISQSLFVRLGLHIRVLRVLYEDLKYPNCDLTMFDTSKILPKFL